MKRILHLFCSTIHEFINKSIYEHLDNSSHSTEFRGFVDMVVTSDTIKERSYEELIDPTCPNCRQTIPWDTDVCPHCGWQIKKGVPAEAPKLAVPTVKKGIKKGNVLAAASVIILGLLGLGSVEYFPPATLICLLMIVVIITQAAAPAE